MKEIEVTKKVMTNVTRFERKRSGRWLLIFYLGLFILVGVVAYGVWQIYQIVSDPEFLDVFSLYSHDTETFTELWKEAVSFLWGNLPQISLLIVVASTVLFFCILLVTRNRRKVVIKRLRQAAKYTQK